MKTISIETGSSSSHKLQWIALALSVSVLSARIAGSFLIDNPARMNFSIEVWLLPLLVVMCITGMFFSDRLSGLFKVLNWGALLLSIWTANMILFDLLTMAGLIGDPTTRLPAAVDWPGFVTRTLSLACAIILGRQALALPADRSSMNPASWYGYAAFVLALPYPVVRILWAFGSTAGLSKAGAGGVGFSPLIIAIPWMLAAVLSILLVNPRRWKPRKLLITAGWTAAAIVATIGPAAFWALIKSYTTTAPVQGDIAKWVFVLFYVSWFLWAIAAAAATRSYQIRSIGKQ